VPIDFEELPIGENAPQLVNAIVEVPVGSRNKYEYDPDLGVMTRDRVLPGAVRYPTDYGFIPSTVADDGDPLDILVAAYDPAFPGCLVRARPVGALDMSDSGGRDRTILAVPNDDPRFADIKSLDDLPAQNLTEVEEFFEVYKRLEGDKEVEIHGWLSLEEAHEVIRDSTRR
jgi:inorganic pyrophosphatase